MKDPDIPYLAEVLDGIEIDGVKFSAAFRDSRFEITMEGAGLSPLVNPNYPAKTNVVKQIVHKSPEARATSSVLNKFIRKVNKVLSREPCNRGKRNPPNIVLIKEIEELDGNHLPDGLG
jgi:2,3-bisphosphoglycerate-independent phosphoglycerate mutase